MALGIVVILVGIVVVGAIVIGLAMLFMGLLSGSSRPMPEPRPDEEHAERQEIMEKLARKEITKDEADAALGAIPAYETESPHPPAQSNVGCIIGIIAAVIIGVLLILGVIMTLLFGRSARYSAEPPMPIELQIDQSVIEEAKELPKDSAGNEPLKSPADSVNVEAEPPPAQASKMGTTEAGDKEGEN